MTTIVTRIGKGSALTWVEGDANFTNLNTDLVAVIAAEAAHEVDTAGAHAASAIANTPAGNIVATDVQAAITELDGQDTTLQTNINTLTARVGTSSSMGFRNRIINPEFALGQRGTSFTSATTPANSDDTYLLDRWTLLSDGNDIVDVTRTTTVPTAPGPLTSIGLDCETVNKKFGIIQFIEQKNCIGLIGNDVVLTFKAKVSSTTKFDNIKAAILTWSSTADTVTSDVVSAWGVEGTNPTLVANWTYDSTPANLGVTTSWATYTVAGLVDTASATNIAVFIWSDVTDTTLGDFIYITDVQLEAGTVATPIERRSFDEELLKCQRYYEKSYDLDTPPATVTDVGKRRYFDGSAAGQNSHPFIARKRSVTGLVVTTYSPVTGASGKYRDESSNADFDMTTTFFLGEMSWTAVPSTHGAADETIAWHYVATNEL